MILLIKSTPRGGVEVTVDVGAVRGSTSGNTWSHRPAKQSLNVLKMAGRLIAPEIRNALKAKKRSNLY